MKASKSQSMLKLFRLTNTTICRRQTKENWWLLGRDGTKPHPRRRWRPRQWILSWDETVSGAFHHFNHRPYQIHFGKNKRTSRIRFIYFQPDILNPPFLRLTFRPLLLDQLTSKVDGGITGSRLRWSIPTYCATPQSSNRVLTSLGNSGLYWTVFAQIRDTAVPAERNGDLHTVICVLAARLSSTLSNPVLWQSWTAAYPSCILQMKMLFPGWPIMVHDMHTRRRSISSQQQALNNTCDQNKWRRI